MVRMVGTRFGKQKKMTDGQIIQILKNKFGAAKRANGPWVRVKCPTCTPNDAMKMKRGVNIKTLSSNCFICERPLSLEQLFGNAQIDLSNMAPYVEPPEHPQARKWPCEAVIPVSALPADHPAVKFLNKDHLLDMTTLAMDYEVGYILGADAHNIEFSRADGTGFSISTADSLVFPVYFKGEMVGWQCRFIPGTTNGDRMKKMKYLHVFPKGKYLYNYDNARNYKSVVVVEGVKKSWKFPNGVATWGKGISEEQIQLIQQWEEIIFMYDAGEDTQRKSKELTDIIKRGKRCINIDPGEFGFASPDEMTEEEAQTIVLESWLKAGYPLQ